MGIVKWFRRDKKAGATAEEQARREAEIEHLKRRAARQTDPDKVKRAAADLLAKLAGSALVILVVSCVRLSPAQQTRLDVFQCRVAAVAPVIEPLADAEEFTRDVLLGKVDPIPALAKAGATLPEIVETARRWNACEPGTPPISDPVPQTIPAANRT